MLTKVSGGGEGLVDDMLELELVFGGDAIFLGLGRCFVETVWWQMLGSRSRVGKWERSRLCFCWKKLGCRDLYLGFVCLQFAGCSTVSHPYLRC